MTVVKNGVYNVGSEYEMTDHGLMSYFLGFEFIQNDKLIFIHQKKFKMDACKPVSAPMVANIKLS